MAGLNLGTKLAQNLAYFPLSSVKWVQLVGKWYIMDKLARIKDKVCVRVERCQRESHTQRNPPTRNA